MAQIRDCSYGRSHLENKKVEVKWNQGHRVYEYISQFNRKLSMFTNLKGKMRVEEKRRDSFLCIFLCVCLRNAIGLRTEKQNEKYRKVSRTGRKYITFIIGTICFIHFCHCKVLIEVTGYCFGRSTEKLSPWLWNNMFFFINRRKNFTNKFITWNWYNDLVRLKCLLLSRFPENFKL